MNIIINLINKIVKCYCPKFCFDKSITSIRGQAFHNFFIFRFSTLMFYVQYVQSCIISSEMFYLKGALFELIYIFSPSCHRKPCVAKILHCKY